LNVILGVCVLVLTFFICWVLYYVAVSFYNMFKIVKEAREGVQKSREVLEALKKRLNSTVALISFFEELAQKVLEIVKKKNDSGTKKKKNTKKSPQKKTKAKNK